MCAERARRSNLTAIGSILCFLFILEVIAQSAFAEGDNLVWTTGVHMQSARTGPGVALGHDGLIYAMGGVDYGYGTSHATNTVERFNETTQVWTYVSSMTSKRHVGAAATDSLGHIWMVGGITDASVTLNSAEWYDPASNTWTLSTAQLNTGRAGLGLAITQGNLLYAIGGLNIYPTALSSVEKYDPASQTWAYVHNMGTARFHPGIALDSAGRIYAIGGENNGCLSSVERYYPALDCWEYVASLPMAMGNAGVFTLGEEIYAVGGWSGGGYTNQCYIYSPDTNTWRDGPDMYEAWGLAKAVVGESGTAYLIGGEGPDIWAHDHVAVLTPEPATLSLVALGGLALLRRSRRK
jgi:N-acetylneuraminic acid mutarotase